jgi:hypothetical protein
MHIAIRAGRDFSPDDPAGALAMIVNETLARRLWPGEDPIGKTVNTDWPGAFTVVGVVADVHQTSVEDPPVAQMYVPYTHVPPGSPDFIVRSSLLPGAILSQLSTTLPRAQTALVFLELRPLDDLVDRATSPRRFLAGLMGAFSIAALALSCLGVYGVVSYTVSRRVRDIGLRMALGANGHDIRREVVGDIVRTVCVAIVVGTTIAFWAAKGLTALLYNTSAADPWIFAGTAALVAAAGLAAAYVPALRAARLDPVVALRAD